MLALPIGSGAIGATDPEWHIHDASAGAMSQMSAPALLALCRDQRTSFSRTSRSRIAYRWCCHFSLRIPSHRTNGLFDTFAGVTVTGEPVRLEFTFDEGNVVGEFEVVVSRVGDGYVLAGHDIGDRKRLERELVELKDQLQAALNSRIAIEQAKGFVAAQLRMTPETAFVAIRRYAPTK